MSDDIGPTLDSDTVWQQLLLLRDQTHMSGVLHDAQLLQLKLWIQLAVPHAVRANLSFDATDPQTRSIRYDVETKGSAPGNFSQLLAGLDRSIKALLGSDWEVSVYGRKLKMLGRLGPVRMFYRGPRQVLQKPAHQYWQNAIQPIRKNDEKDNGE